MTTYVTFDKRSGQILGVHHGAIDAKDARSCAQHHKQYDAKSSDEHIEVMAISCDALDKDKLYKLDVGRKALVAATAQDGGVGFGFGEMGGTSSGA